jgi:hypothetical protein
MTSQESSLKINEALKGTLNEFLKFPLSEAIAGRRARRFCVGAEIPDGVREIEQLLLLSYMGGVTGWHFAIMRHERYAPKLSNYCTSPVGRTFPSAAGLLRLNYSILMIMEHTFFLHVIFIQRFRLLMAK